MATLAALKTPGFLTQDSIHNDLDDAREAGILSRYHVRMAIYIRFDVISVYNLFVSIVFRD